MRRLLIPLFATIALTGCGEGSWFGAAPKPPLPGERIAVLAAAGGVEADPRIADVPVAIPQAVDNKDWPTVGGSAERNLGHVALGAQLKEAWSTSVGSGSSRTRRMLASPVAGDGRIYTMDADMNVTAVAADTGRRIWSVDPSPEDEEDGFGGGIAFDAGKLFVAGGFAQVLALDAATGKELWRRPTTGPVRSSPLAVEGRVYVTTIDNRTEAFDETTGESQWSYTGTAEPTAMLGGGTPGFSQGIVVAPYSSGEVVALRSENGRPVWTDSLAALRRGSSLSAMSDVRGSPVIADGRVYAASLSTRIAAIDLRTGNRTWDGEFGGTNTVWYAGDYVYVLSRDGDLVCARSVDGAVRWVITLPRLEDPDNKTSVIQWTGPILAGDRLIVANSNEQVWLISPYDGQKSGELRLPGAAYIPPIVVDRTLYVLTDDARLTAFR